MEMESLCLSYTHTHLKVRLGPFGSAGKWRLKCPISVIKGKMWLPKVLRRFWGPSKQKNLEIK